MRNKTLVFKLSFFILFSVASCDSTMEKDVMISLENGKYTLDSNGVKNGRYMCPYNNGKIWMTGTIKNDTINVYEELIFYPTGQLMEYRFYNPIGDEMYKRTYDEKGKLKIEEGDFFSHNQLDNYQIRVGDSTSLKIYVASPPGTEYKIFGVNSKGRYEIHFEKTDTLYFQKLILHGDKVGNYILPLEIEFTDKINGTVKVSTDNVCYEVI